MSLVHASALAVFELRGDIPTFEGEFWLAAYQEQIRSVRQLTRGLEYYAARSWLPATTLLGSIDTWMTRIEAYAQTFKWKAWRINAEASQEAWMHDLATLTLQRATDLGTIAGVTQEDWQHFLDAWCRRRACDWEPLADGEPCFEQGDIERLEQQELVQLPTCQNCAVLVDMATVCGQERKSVL